jgi:phosphotransferase system HPr-like phosphotransfer protein
MAESRPQPARPSERAQSVERIADDGGVVPAALDRVLREQDFRPRLAVEVRDLFRLAVLLDHGVKGEVSRRFCLLLAEEAERVEFALLDVGARGNREYAFFVEVVTTVRWTARSLHALLHLRGRIRRYLGDRTDLADFRRDLDGCIRWLGERLAACLEAAREEAEGPLKMTTPREPFEMGHAKGEDVRWRLPQDVDAAEAKDEREHIAAVASQLLALADEACTVGAEIPESDAALPAWSRTVFGAPQAHEWRVRMHTVQSGYDAYVGATPLEGSDAQLKMFRGYVSILLHLLEAVAFMLQLQARLDMDVRSARVRERASAIVEGGDLLRWAARFGLANAVLCFREVRGVARALIGRYTRRREATFDLPPGRKLHLRPAGLIVKVVLHHGLPVDMRMGEQSVDARQLMDVILLAASHPASTQVTFQGDDRALSDLALLFQHKLGEDGLENLPQELSYLQPKPSGPC